MKLNTLVTTALLTLTAPAAWAESIITVMKPTAFETAATAMAGGGFMHITNDGDTDDTLLGVKADFPRVELHTTEFTDGIAKMMHVDAIPVPAGGMVALEPGGYHVMFMGLRGDPLEIGETIPATLIFEHAGEIEISFEVVERTMRHKH
ncbi:copper chaperone PCu(A)C [Yoonia maritima]|uniref:copper chaperone PCu(A)C n=1 Tax=Yoonia maritima TaxID=1435347 RepID=UPI00373589BD